MRCFDLFHDGELRIGFVIGTGPSMTSEIAARIRPWRKFGCNNTYSLWPSTDLLGLDVHLACNIEWWDTYWSDIQTYPCHKWTTRPRLNEKYPGLNYIEERWEPGLSRDPNYICAHHGSGPQILNLALLYGCDVMLLVGWDMRYHKDRRHYFGEYPSHLQHWPRTGPNGELAGLISEMETIDADALGVDIINCTPGSALTHFPMMDLEEAIEAYLL